MTLPSNSSKTTRKLFTIAILISLTPFLTISCVTKNADTSSSETQTKREKKKKGLTVWFVKAKGEELELVEVPRPKTGSDPVEAAVSELLMGPDEEESSKGISSEIPRGTILLGIEKDGEKIELNLSKRFTAGGGPTSIQTRLDQLSRTVTRVAGDSKVYLSVEGERLSANQFDGLEIKQPIN
ncbi:hypothetical protein GC174_13755 [bacterium]|nr:hypothetical protein [bacterium]